jgi:hypothetical protein
MSGIGAPIARQRVLDPYFETTSSQFERASAKGGIYTVDVLTRMAKQ